MKHRREPSHGWGSMAAHLAHTSLCDHPATLRHMFNRPVSPPSDLEAGEQHRRRSDYLAEGDRIRNVWARKIAHRGGLLPGATLDPFVTPRGWCGHVQAFITQTEVLSGYDSRKRLQSSVEQAYGLPRGAVLIDRGWQGIGDTAFIWAFSRPGDVDYHERLPHTVFGEDFAGESTPPGQLTRLEKVELAAWARKHHDMLVGLRTGQYPVDMTQLVRRYNRMRGAILDALTRVDPAQVKAILGRSQLSYHDLGEDVGDLLGMGRDEVLGNG